MNPLIEQAIDFLLEQKRPTWVSKGEEEAFFACPWCGAILSHPQQRRCHKCLRSFKHPKTFKYRVVDKPPSHYITPKSKVSIMPSGARVTMPVKKHKQKAALTQPIQIAPTVPIPKLPAPKLVRSASIEQTIDNLLA